MPSASEAMPGLATHDAKNTKPGVPTPRQIRAARALIGWSREKLAKASGVPAVTIGEFETGKVDSRWTTVRKMQRAMERAGVFFIDADGQMGAGVRLRSPE